MVTGDVQICIGSDYIKMSIGEKVYVDIDGKSDADIINGFRNFVKGINKTGRSEWDHMGMDTKISVPVSAFRDLNLGTILKWFEDGHIDEYELREIRAVRKGCENMGVL